ncbi:MAG TPA: biotin/lipoyl-containing protein, partial [Acidothermaceae bacterium]
MASLKQFKLPDVGEGLTEAEVVRWLVQVGDRVTQNQTIVEIETAKALVELPSPFAGVVTELLVGEGTTVDVGTPIIIIDIAPTATAAPNAESATDAAGAVAAASASPARTPKLVG